MINHRKKSSYSKNLQFILRQKDFIILTVMKEYIPMFFNIIQNFTSKYSTHQIDKVCVTIV